MEDNSVLSLFEITTNAVSIYIDRFPRQSIQDLPVNILSTLLEYLSAYHLELYDDIFIERGINTGRAWIAHYKKRWPKSYETRIPVFKNREPPSYKQRYFQKHFHDCLQAMLTGSVSDPSQVWLQQPLRNENIFFVKPLVRSGIKKEVYRYARYASTVTVRNTLCKDIVKERHLLEILQKSTKVLETFATSFPVRQNAELGAFIELFKSLTHSGCLEEVHIHFPDYCTENSFRSYIQIVRECVGQDPRFSSRLPFLRGIRSPSKPTDTGGSASSQSGDLYDEALSTLECRNSEREFEQFLEVANEIAVTDDVSDLMDDSNQGTETKEPGASLQRRQLSGFACFDICCCGETARELAYAFMCWDKLEKLVIHHFSRTGMSMNVAEDSTGNPDFDLLCQVLLYKVQGHQLTQLVLLERTFSRGDRKTIVKFYTSLIAILNNDYRVSASGNWRRPFQHLRIPVVYGRDEEALFSGRKITQPVRAVEELIVEFDPTYPHYCHAAARDLAAFVISFIRFDASLTALNLTGYPGSMYRNSDNNFINICSAIAANSRITTIELDSCITSQAALDALFNMIQENQNLSSVSLHRVDVVWEDEQAKGVLCNKLISVVKHHQSLTSLMLKGRLAGIVNGNFLVDFVTGLFQGGSLPKLQQLDISESGLTTDDLLRMASELKGSPLAHRFPALEYLSVRNTLTARKTTLSELNKVKHELKSLAYIVDVTFEERFGYQAELLAQM